MTKIHLQSDFFVKFQWSFLGISQNFKYFGKNDVKILILPKNLKGAIKVLSSFPLFEQRKALLIFKNLRTHRFLLYL